MKFCTRKLTIHNVLDTQIQTLNKLNILVSDTYPTPPTLLLTDEDATLSTSIDHRITERNKHIEVKHFLNQKKIVKIVKIVKIPEKQLASSEDGGNAPRTAMLILYDYL